MAIDAADDCTFWYTAEYYQVTASFDWSTRLASFKFPSCSATPNFTIGATPSSQSVPSTGGNAPYTVTISALNGFTDNVNLVASGMPTGVTVGFGTNPVLGGSGSSTMTATVASGTTPGTYTLTVTGTDTSNSSLSHSTTVTLVVNPPPDFSISASPSSQTVTPGNGTSYTVTVGALNGYSGTVSFSVSGLPTGAGATFNPTSVTGSGTSTMTVTTSSTTPAGSYPLTITGSDGTLTHTANVTLVVNSVASGDFTISASPASQTVKRGSSTSYAVTITGSGGFAGTVSFSVIGLPQRSNASFTPSTVTGSGNSTLTVKTNKPTPTGTYTLIITGTSGSLIHTATVTLVVQ